MSKRNGVFRSFLKTDKVRENRFFIILTPTNEKGDTEVLDHKGTVWTFHTPVDADDRKTDWNVKADVVKLMKRMKKLRNDFLAKRAALSDMVKAIEYTGNETLRMSFYNGTLDRSMAKGIIRNTTRPVVYTYGFEYRDPTINHKPIEKTAAYGIIDKESFLDIDFRDDLIHLNAYSCNDMY